MKKVLKACILIIFIVVITIIIDIVSVFVFCKPVFAIKQKCICGMHDVYKGILYDTYCFEEYTIYQIKPKWYICEKINAAVNASNVIKILDKTQNMNNFTCAEALEGFFEDGDYEYYFSCIKGKYIVVQYANGYEETVREALKRGRITIQDLDLYGISYIKYKK